jgi:hypothetical protein
MTTAWFHRKKVLAAIDELGAVDSLLIYAGAGVTIDRTGMSWSDLVSCLFQKCGYTPTEAKALVSDLSPGAAATCAFGLLSDKHGASTQKATTNILRDEIYQHKNFMGGQTSKAIADLALRWAKTSRDVCVATTNYDEYLVVDAREAAVVLAPKGQPVAGIRVTNLLNPASGPSVVVAPANGSESWIEYVFLHGYVPENAAITAHPVIAEEDYFRARDATAAWLSNAMETKNVLVVGSSLTDPPLLTALLDTRQAAEGRGLKRTAILPLPSILGSEAKDYTGRQLEKYLDALAARMSTFGVRLVFPDHFSQVGQFVTELTIAAAEPPRTYAGGNRRYGRRLFTWWTSWQHGLTMEGFDERQRADHQLLVERLAEIQQQLDCSDEVLKLDVWLRWNTAEQRELRLWASSAGTFASEAVLRTAPIKRESDAVAVQTFRSGQAEHFPSGDESLPRPPRWKAYLCAPLYLSERSQIPAGAVVLASMQDHARSALRVQRIARHEHVLGTMKDVGRTIARDI